MTNAVKASTEKLEKQMTETKQEMRPGMSLASLLRTDTIKRRFEEVLGKKSPAFLSSILSATATNKALATCEPMSIISAAAIAATLDLPINQSLGFAHIVPYKSQAQFQCGWRGYVQLAMRTGQYRTMNVAEVYEGQLLEHDPFTGQMRFDAKAKTSDKIIGYVAYFSLLNGFEKYNYLTVEQVESHGKRYSKSFSSDFGQWKQNFPAMAKKTAIKGLLSKWGILSVEMQTAIASDQAIISQDGTPQYVDATTGEILPTEASLETGDAQEPIEAVGNGNK